MNEQQIRAKIQRLEKACVAAADRSDDRYEQLMAEIERLQLDLYDLTGDREDI